MQGIEVLFMGNNFLRLLSGLWVTVRISLISIAFSLVLGTLLGAVMTSRNRVVRVLCRVYLEVVRIMPQLVWLFIVFFGVTRLTGANFGGETSAVIVFTIWGAAEMGDLVRGAFQAIPRHQFESSLSLGLTKPQMYINIIFSAGIAQSSSERHQPRNAYDKDHGAGVDNRRNRGSQGRKADNRREPL